MTINRNLNIRGRGARGQSQADILRVTGQYGVLPTDSDAQAMTKLNAFATAAQVAAELAAEQAADLVLPANKIVGGTLAAAHAAVPIAGTNFEWVDTATQIAQVRKRTAGGSDLLFELPTKAALTSPTGADMIGTPYGPLFTIIDRTHKWSPLEFGATGSGDDTTKLADWAASGEKLTMPKGALSFRTDAPLIFAIEGTVVDARGSRSRIACGQRNAGRGMIEVTASDCILDGLRLENPDLLGSATGQQFFAALNRANRTRMMNMRVYDFEMGLTTSAGANSVGTPVEGEFYDAWYLNNIVRVFGQGAGTEDDELGRGEDRGDAITHFGGRCWIIGNRVFPRDGTDCRGAIFLEALSTFAIDTTGVDNASTAFVANNHVGVAQGQANGGGRFRKGIDVEQYPRAIVQGNVVRSCAWFAYQVAGKSDMLLMAGNTAYMDCPATNANGGSWTPARAAYHIYPNGQNVVGVMLDGNTSYHTTAGFRALMINGLVTSVMPDLVVRGQKAFADSSLDMGAVNAIEIKDFAAGSSVTIDSLEIRGRWNHGIAAFTVPEVIIHGGSIRGVDDIGVQANVVTKLRIGQGLTIANVPNAMETANVTDGEIDGLVTDTVASNWLLNAGTSTIKSRNNSVISGAGNVANFGTLTIPVWRNNTGFSYLKGSATYDPSSVAAGAAGGASLGISVPGAVAGDRVSVSWSAVTGGAVPMGAVSAVDTVTGGFLNLTGAAIDLASGTMTVAIERGL